MSDTERKEIITTIMAAIGDLEYYDDAYIDSAIEKLETLAEEIASKSFTTLEVGPGY